MPHHRESCTSRYVAFLLLMVVCAVPTPAALNINTDAVQKSVVFLYSSDLTGKPDDPQKSLGTGFFLRVPLTSDPKPGYILLVTARHIVDPQWAQCNQSNPLSIYARLTKSGKTEGTAFVSLPLVQNAQPLWKHPSDGMADAAVLVVQSPDTTLRDVDTGTLPISDIPTDDEIKAIGVGDQIVSAGLLPGFAGSKRNRPFFKFGFISSTSDETIETRCVPTAPWNIRGWFLAANLVSGNSGSPVYFVPPGGPGIVFGSAVQRPVLLGIQSSSLVQADLAVMTQSSFLYEAIQLLHLPDANLQRGQPSSPQQK